MRARRRSRIIAVNTIAASFASSDGWMPNPPMPNHRLVPLIGRENSTATSIRPTTPSSSQIILSLR